MRILILGGSTEATRLAHALAGDPALEPVLSLAGRTRNPVLPPIPYRVGGFGGVSGLAAYLRTEGIGLVVDATHPFAERMSANAEAACRETGVQLAVFTRPPWTAQAGDNWAEADGARAAALAIGAASRRVFLTVGRQQVPAFEAAPQHHYLIRAIDPPDPAPHLPQFELLLARGPFTLADELRVMEENRIEVLVSKNSGGEAARAKLDAARRLGIPVVLMRAPSREGLVFHDLDPLLRFLHRPAP
jgi:precorrin-6A/cobalt-precorrin-6A reductase